MLAEYVEKCSFIDKTTNVVWLRVVALYQTTILVLLKRSPPLLLYSFHYRQTYLHTTDDRPVLLTDLLQRFLTTPQTKDRQKTDLSYTHAIASNLGRSTRFGRRQLFGTKTRSVKPPSPWKYLPCKNVLIGRRRETASRPVDLPQRLCLRDPSYSV